MIKIRKYLILIFLCVIVCSVIPFNPIINTESTNPKLSVIHDITINSPQATTYDGPMEGYFPGYFGFEDTEFIHEHWGSGVSIVNEKSDPYSVHRKVLDLYDSSFINYLSASDSFTGRQSGSLEFWFLITESSKAGYVKLYESGIVKIELRLFNGWISYKVYSGNYIDIIEFSENRWYMIEITFDKGNHPINDPGGFTLKLNHNEINSDPYPYINDINPNINQIEFCTDSQHAFYHMYIDAIGYEWETAYWDRKNNFEGIWVDFTCGTELLSSSYKIDNVNWESTFSKDSFVIPMIGGGLHSIIISGVDENFVTHESETIYFTIEELLGWGADAIDAEVVWGGTEDARNVIPGNPAGEGINMLIIDSGIDINHPDLINNLDPNNYGYDFNNNDSIPEDTFGHGTHCAGIIGAVDNSVGVIGVAPSVNLFAAKCGDEIPDVAQTVDAIYWAINNNIDVISMSFTLGSEPTITQACEDAYNAGITMVAAVGNQGFDYIPEPAALPTILAIGAVKYEYGEYNWWDRSNRGSYLDLVAPGVGIFSTLPNGEYGFKRGTSMACPMVSGVCALLLSKKPTLTPALIREALTSTATDLGPSGWDEKYGWGMVNPIEALNYNFEGTIQITSPSDNSRFAKGSDILFKASAFDYDGVAQVQFKVDSHSWEDGQYNPSNERWEWLWDDTENHATGWHTIQCRLIDGDGVIILSDTIDVETYTPIVKPSSFQILKGSLIEGSLLYVLYYDGVYLRIRDTGWWPVYSSQTKFNFPYNEDWIYETLHIYLAGYDGLEHVRIHYTDGTTALYSNVGSGHIELNLDHTRTVDYALVEHVNWWFVRRISIDYIWISYYDPT